MPKTIVIDAGHGGRDSGAVYGNRAEKDDNLDMALAVGEILQNNGVEVVYTRTEDIYQQPLEKARIANEAMGDFFVSIHRNSGAVPGQYSGAETLVYENSGIKAEMAARINEELEKAGFRNLGVDERPGLAVLRRTRMPAVLVEVGFLNNEQDNELFDSRFQEIAQAIADGILNTLSDTYGQEEPQKEKFYSIQTGAFQNRKNAFEMLFALTGQGFPAWLSQDGEVYRVRVGAWETMDAAADMERLLRQYGYSTWMAELEL